MTNRLLIVFISLILISCGNERKEYSVTFVFDKPVSNSQEAKYPGYFKEIALPFSTECQFDFLPKPINISRLDISNKEVETNAWYFKDMGDNTIEFSKGWLEQYFKDSTNTYLSQLGAKQVNIENWIENNKENLYIYSEEAEVSEFKGIPVYNKTKDLTEKIRSSACKNTSGKVVILINPSILASVQQQGTDSTSNQQPIITSFITQPTSISVGSSATLNWSTQNATGVSISGLGEFAANSSTQVTPSKTTTYTLIAKGQNNETTTSNLTVTVGKTPPPPPPLQNDCNKQVSASSVQDLFSQVASGKIPDCQKNSLMKSWSKYFTSDATVTYVHNDCSSNLAPMSIENFLYTIKGKNKTPYIQSDCNNKKVGGKYQSLSVQ